MIALVVLVVSVAALDSLNPSTVAPALVLAIGSRPRRDLAAFTAGVAATSTLGGLVLLVGPGRELLARLSRPSPDTRDLVELATGLLLLVGGVAVWTLRARLRRRLDSDARLGGRSSLSVGAAIMAVELPTAVPYFAAILATVETTRSLAGPGFARARLQPRLRRAARRATRRDHGAPRAGRHGRDPCFGEC